MFGIPSPPLALLVLMLPKGHLTLDFRMSNSRWVITPLWLSGSLRYFLYISSVYFCHLLISSAGAYRFCLFLVPIFAWNVALVSLIFLKRSLVFPILLFSSISLQRFLCLLAFEPEIQLPTSAESSKKQESSRKKTSTSALLTMPKPLTVWTTINSGKFLKEWEYQTTWSASWDICMQVKKQQLEL